MTTFDDLVRLTYAQRAQLHTLDSQTRARASQLAERSVAQLSRYIAAVVRNNPAMSANEVLARSDVVQMMTTLESDLQARLRLEVMTAHTRGSTLGGVHVSAVANAMGLPSENQTMLTSPHTNRILADVQRNAATALQQSVQALRDAWDEPQLRDPLRDPNPVVHQARDRATIFVQRMETVQRRLSFRTGLSASAATTRAYQDTQLREYQRWRANGIAVELVWVADFLNGRVPCEDCQALHGQRVAPGSPFWQGHAYFDAFAPPRHPNCRCRLVPYIPALGVPTPLAAGVSKPVKVRASEVRQMPEEKYTALLAFFSTVASVFKRRKKKRG